MAQPGRPLKFKTKKDLEAKINAYFRECDPHWIVETEWRDRRTPEGKTIYDADGYPEQVERKVKVLSKQVPYTITGLALAIGSSRESLLEYQDRPEFVDTIKAAKLRCQQYAENSLYGSNATGPIFSLKNNYGWRDKTEVELSGEVKRDASEEELDAIIARGTASQTSPTPEV